MTFAFDYVRASTQEENKQGSNERQRIIIRQYTKSREYDLKFIEDMVRFRKSTQRTDFRKMLNALDNEPKVVIAAKISTQP
jgi:DNA invertase Pin-like site-specific DNA recombinase